MRRGGDWPLRLPPPGAFRSTNRRSCHRKVPGEGIEVTRLSKLDLERHVPGIALLDQCTIVADCDFARSLQICVRVMVQLQVICERVAERCARSVAPSKEEPFCPTRRQAADGRKT